MRVPNILLPQLEDKPQLLGLTFTQNPATMNNQKRKLANNSIYNSVKKIKHVGTNLANEAKDFFSENTCITDRQDKGRSKQMEIHPETTYLRQGVTLLYCQR